MLQSNYRIIVRIFMTSFITFDPDLVNDCSPLTNFHRISFLYVLIRLAAFSYSSVISFSIIKKKRKERMKGRHTRPPCITLRWVQVHFFDHGPKPRVVLFTRSSRAWSIQLHNGSACGIPCLWSNAADHFNAPLVSLDTICFYYIPTNFNFSYLMNVTKIFLFYFLLNQNMTINNIPDNTLRSLNRWGWETS